MGQRIKRIYNTLSTGIYTLKKKEAIETVIYCQIFKKLDIFKNYC